MNAISSTSLEASPFPADHDRRAGALEAALAADAPSAESEEWRYSPIGDLDLASYSATLERPEGVDLPIIDELVDGAAGASEVVTTVTIVDGWITSVSPGPKWPATGLTVETVETRQPAGPEHPEADQLDLLHQALAPSTLVISVKPGATIDGSIIIQSHHRAGGRAAFPHVRVEAGSDAEVSIIEYQTSEPGAGLSVPLLELQAAVRQIRQARGIQR